MQTGSSYPRGVIMAKRLRSPNRRHGQITGYLKGDLAEWFENLLNSVDRANVTDFVEAALENYKRDVERYGLNVNLLPAKKFERQQEEEEVTK